MIKRLKEWWYESDLRDFVKEFTAFCAIITVLLLCIFGPLILAAGPIQRPQWLILYIPLFALGMTVYDQHYS